MFGSIDADLFNFVDDNNLSSIGHAMDEAKTLLTNETEAALSWIEANENDRKSREIHSHVSII